MMRQSPPTWNTRLWISAPAIVRSTGTSSSACSGSATFSGHSPMVAPRRCGWWNPAP